MLESWGVTHTLNPSVGIMGCNTCIESECWSQPILVLESGPKCSTSLLFLQIETNQSATFFEYFSTPFSLTVSSQNIFNLFPTLPTSPHFSDCPLHHLHFIFPTSSSPIHISHLVYIKSPKSISVYPYTSFPIT